VAGVTSLEALAYPFVFSGLKICAMVDARKGEVYTSQYDTADGRLRLIRKIEATSPEKAARNAGTSFLYAGNGARIYKELIRSVLGEESHFAPSCLMQIRAGNVGLLGLEMLMKTAGDPLSSFLPRYVRASDAEKMRTAEGKA
jgi:tRNA threonylcarbamoyladenosine biosynthesis protein TsaB